MFKVKNGLAVDGVAVIDNLGKMDFAQLKNNPTTLVGYGITDAAAAAPVQSVAGKTGTVALVKADVGLSNVDNTSDANKPVSVAQQDALNLKMNATGGSMKGYTEKVNALTVTTLGTDIDFAFNHTALLMQSNTTLTVSNVPTVDVYSHTLKITQDATGGRTITWPASVIWDGGLAPDISTAAGKTAFVSFLKYAGDSNIYGFVRGKQY